MNKVQIGVYRTITVCTSDGDPVVIGEDDGGAGDGSGTVTVKCNTDCYGKLDFSMDPTTAKAMAEAILEQVKNIEGK